MIRQGMVVVVKSQCPYEGSDLSVYETGHAALKAGVFQAYDMSTEAVVTKIMWLLGNFQKREEIEKYFHKNLAGELRIPENHPAVAKHKGVSVLILKNIFMYLAFINVLAFACFGIDKQKAKTHQWRDLRKNSSGHRHLRRFCRGHSGHAFLSPQDPACQIRPGASGNPDPAGHCCNPDIQFSLKGGKHHERIYIRQYF